MRVTQSSRAPRAPLLRPRRRRATRPSASTDAPPSTTGGVFLSDLLSFESDGGAPVPPPRRPADGAATVERASAALADARAALAEARARAPVSGKRGGGGAKSEPPTSFEFASGRRDVRSGGGSVSTTTATTTPFDRHAVPDWAAAGPTAPPTQDGTADTAATTLELERAPDAAPRAALPFADAPAAPAVLNLRSQSAEDTAAAAATTSLPPLQSALEAAASAVAADGAAAAATAVAAAATADGSGKLADGTTYVRESGEERGPGGLWHRWTRVEGATADGAATWTETWWETTDWAGRKEMGAEKSGTTADGAAWREAWREAVGYDGGVATVVRTAHKWGRAATVGAHATRREWEEKWDESYWADGRATKSADKWAVEGGDDWHERWGEEYDGRGGCVKWTDKWAARPREGAPHLIDRWGDKWEERFSGGTGTKTGETWSEGGDGGVYRRWWGEDHTGGGWVRRHGHSTTGEQWDTSDQGGTYYNPIPHFTYDMALAHSPGLTALPTLPRGGEAEEDEGVAGL